MFDNNMQLLTLSKKQKSNQDSAPRRQTFAQLQGRDRGLSTRLSVAVKKKQSGVEFGALVKEEGELHALYDESTRKK